MRLPCNLREIRGKRPMIEIARAAKVAEAELSKIERGLALPRDEWMDALEEAYGAPRHEWWPPAVLVVLEAEDSG